MRNKILFIAMFLVVSVLLLTAGSCKDRRTAKTSEPFDPAIDGIAVRPLPSVDIELARLTVKKGLDTVIAENAFSLDSIVPAETTAVGDVDDNAAEQPARSDPNS